MVGTLRTCRRLLICLRMPGLGDRAIEPEQFPQGGGGIALLGVHQGQVVKGEVVDNAPGDNPCQGAPWRCGPGDDADALNGGVCVHGKVGIQYCWTA